jgi:hypothetical protein
MVFCLPRCPYVVREASFVFRQKKKRIAGG